MIWHCMIWCCMIWCLLSDVVWSDVVWSDAAFPSWRCLTWRFMIWLCLNWCCMIWCRIIWCCMIRCWMICIDFVISGVVWSDLVWSVVVWLWPGVVWRCAFLKGLRAKVLIGLAWTLSAIFSLPMLFLNSTVVTNDGTIQCRITIIALRRHWQVTTPRNRDSNLQIYSAPLKAKWRVPAYLRALRRIRGVVQRVVQGTKSDFQMVRGWEVWWDDGGVRVRVFKEMTF